MAMGAKINGSMVHRLREDNALLEHKTDDVEEAKIIDSETAET